MPVFLARLIQRELVLDPRVRLLGLIPIACFLFHYVRYAWVLEQPANMLWMCHVTALALGIGLVFSWANVIRVSAIWALVGLPLWIVEVVARGYTSGISVMSHVAVPIVAFLAMTQVRYSSAWLIPQSMGVYLVVQHVCRVITIPSFNINLAHQPYDGIPLPFPMTYPIFWSIITTALTAVVALSALLFKKVFRADKLFADVVGEPSIIVHDVAAPAPAAAPTVVENAEPGFRMAPKLTPQEARAQAAAMGYGPKAMPIAPPPKAEPARPPPPGSSAANHHFAPPPNTWSGPNTSNPAPAAAPPASSPPQAIPSPPPSRGGAPSAPAPAGAAAMPSPPRSRSGLSVERVKPAPTGAVPDELLRNTRGFTLLEMMLVVSILGIMAAMAVPDLAPAVHTARMRSSADDVVAFLERARRDARGEGRCMRVTPNVVGSTFFLSLEKRTTANCFGNITDANWTQIQFVQLPKGFSFTFQSLDGSSSIVFRPSGRQRGNGNLIINDDGAGFIISFPPLPTKKTQIQVTPAGRICAFMVTGTPAPLAAPVVCGAPTTGSPAPPPSGYA